NERRDSTRWDVCSAPIELLFEAQLNSEESLALIPRIQPCIASSGRVTVWRDRDSHFITLGTLVFIDAVALARRHVADEVSAQKRHAPPPPHVVLVGAPAQLSLNHSSRRTRPPGQEYISLKEPL